MAESEQKSIYVDVEKPDGSTAFTIVSADNTPKSASQFEAAKDFFLDNDGKQPQGFHVITSPILQRLRVGFEENIADPLRSGASSIRQLPQMQGGTAGDPNLIAGLLNMAKGAVPSMLEGMSTPEGFGATVGGAVGSLASGGVSAVPATMNATLGALLGSGTLGPLLRGGQVDFGKIATETALVGAGQGFVGAMKHLLGKSVSERALNQVAEDVGNLLEREYRHVINDPHALLAVEKTPKGMSDLAQIGIKAVMSDFDDMATSLTSQIQQALSPVRLSRGSQNTLRAQLRIIRDASEEMLDNYGDTKKIAAAHKSFNDAVTKVRQLAVDDLKPKTNSAARSIVSSIDGVFTQYAQSLDKLTPTASVLKAMKDAGAKEGFKVERLQEALLDNYASNPGSLLHSVGLAAGRGAELTAGTDSPVKSLAQRALDLSKITRFLGIQLPPTGQRYVGNVRGALKGSDVPVGTATREAIRGFVEDDR